MHVASITASAGDTNVAITPPGTGFHLPPRRVLDTGQFGIDDSGNPYVSLPQVPTADRALLWVNSDGAAFLLPADDPAARYLWLGAGFFRVSSGEDMGDMGAMQERIRAVLRPPSGEEMDLEPVVAIQDRIRAAMQPPSGELDLDGMVAAQDRIWAAMGPRYAAIHAARKLAKGGTAS